MPDKQRGYDRFFHFCIVKSIAADKWTTYAEKQISPWKIWVQKRNIHVRSPTQPYTLPCLNNLNAVIKRKQNLKLNLDKTCFTAHRYRQE